MAKPYKNAANILPLKLLTDLQKYHQGLLWVPESGGERARRDYRIGKLHRRGVGVKEIASRVGLTERRVRQILRQRGLSKRKPT